MSSPAAAANEDQTASSSKVMFRFCTECSNLLFPREDKENNQLMFTCRSCNYSEEATNPCIMRHEIASSVGDTAGITQDVAQDPTLPRIQKPCTACGENEAVFFQSQQRTAETGMKLYYVCCACGHVWQ